MDSKICLPQTYLLTLRFSYIFSPSTFLYKANSFIADFFSFSNQTSVVNILTSKIYLPQTDLLTFRVSYIKLFLCYENFFHHQLCFTKLTFLLLTFFYEHRPLLFDRKTFTISYSFPLHTSLWPFWVRLTKIRQNVNFEF